MGELFIKNKQRLRAVERLEIEPRDFNETVTFWRRLGFQVTIQGEPGQRLASLKAGELRVKLTEDERRAHDRRRNPFTALRIALSVRDFDAYLADLRQKGIAAGEPSFEHGFTRGVEIVDPNGIRVLVEEAA